MTRFVDNDNASNGQKNQNFDSLRRYLLIAECFSKLRYFPPAQVSFWSVEIVIHCRDHTKT